MPDNGSGAVQPAPDNKSGAAWLMLIERKQKDTAYADRKRRDNYAENFE